MKKKSGLKKVIDENTKVLILGSLPGDQSIKEGKYYSNPTNQFWKLIGEVIGNDRLKDEDYKDKLNILLKKKIGLWDIYKKAEREGSTDKNIKSAELNDFKTLKKYPNLKVIFVNGLKNGKIAKKVLPEALPEEFEIIPLESSSSARSITFKKKLSSWMKIKKHI